MSEFEFFSSEVSDKIVELSKKARQSTIIDSSWYTKYDVKRGLRDLDGKGVLAGLTEISEIQAFSKDEQGNKVPMDGELYYRGIGIQDLIGGFIKEDRFGFEEVIYLLLFGELPNKSQLKSFKRILSGFRTLPTSFVRDIIMKAPSADLMNVLARSVLILYSYDDHADDTGIANVLRQCLQLIAQFPLISVYGHQVARHYHHGDSLIIHQPDKKLSIAENILHLLREDSKFTKLEARVLDMCLILHAEHGGGNNSSFTMHVVSSTGTDTYSAVAASLGALKGPRHGGANIKAIRMMDDLKANVKNYSDKYVEHYIAKLLDKKAFDKAGLVYGMGHAVYSLSDPRAVILKKYARLLAEEKGMQEEFDLYDRVEKIASELISERRKIYKGVSANVDFYSGFVYRMLGLPEELFAPIFAVSRITGWSAHRIEELSNNGKIIRPGYESVCARKSYVPIDER